MTLFVTGITALRPPAPPRRAPQFADVLVTDSKADAPGAALGSVVATSAGDLQGATPGQALRSRLIRMISNPPNAYAHLRDWGLGLKRGGLATPSLLSRMSLQAQRMLREDPDVRDAKVTITVAPMGIRRSVLVEVEIQTRAGLTDKFLTTIG